MSKSRSGFKKSQAHKGAITGIHIKPANRGKFTAKANAAGMGVQAYAQKEKHAGGALGKEANFAINFGGKK